MRAVEQARALGEALLGVLRAEVDALRGDYRRAAARFTAAMVVFGFAAGFAFWAVGALAFVAFELLARWLPRWGAAAALCALFAAVAGALGWWGARRLRAIEPPLATASRHLEEHLRWWQERVLDRSGAPGGSAEADEAGKVADPAALGEGRP
jgi:hypothetical protein